MRERCRLERSLPSGVFVGCWLTAGHDGECDPIGATGAPAPDMVNAPPHYKRGGLEAIDVIEAFGLGFHEGNATKYILRAGHKGDRLEDLRKARWYIDRAIEKGGAK